MITTSAEAIRRMFKTTGPLPNIRPRYNMAPTQDAPIVRVTDQDRELTMLRWGLVPSWSDGPDSRYRMINARAETVATKPAFRSAFKLRRCLVPADGFYEWQKYEWQKTDGGKQPYRIALQDGELFAFAGLWERWGVPRNEIVESFTIMVTEANEFMHPIHDRMPVILEAADYDQWLQGSDVEQLLKPFPSDAMTAYPVSTYVNSPKNDDPACIEPLQEIGALKDHAR